LADVAGVDYVEVGTSAVYRSYSDTDWIVTLLLKVEDDVEVANCWRHLKPLRELKMLEEYNLLGGTAMQLGTLLSNSIALQPTKLLPSFTIWNMWSK
jgi:hypothetical protein